MNTKKKKISSKPPTSDESKAERYDEFDLENLVLSDAIKDGALKGNSLDQMHVMLRAMSVLGFKIQDLSEQNTKRFEELDSKVGKISKEIRCIKKTQAEHTSELKAHHEQIEDLNKRLKVVEKMIA